MLRQKGRSCNHFCSAVPPGFRLRKGRRRSNAVTGRNRPVLIDALCIVRTDRSGANFSPCRTWKPFQPVKLLSLPDTLHVLSPSLRFCISGFYNQKSSYHISARFASAEADFTRKSILSNRQELVAIQKAIKHNLG